MSSTLKAFILVLSIQLVTCLAVTCREGHKVVLTRGAPFCDLCENGTFITEKNHSKTECDKCTQVRDANTEVVVRECRAEEDALIVCKAGFFRDGTCKKCTVCEAGHEIQPCDSHRDTICCSSDNYYVHVDNDGHKMCKVRTLPCRQGQFFVSEHNCTSCPPGTYMVDNHHSFNSCISCQQLPNNSDIDEYVAKVCNITCSSSSVGGCRHGLTPDTGKDIHIVDLNRTDNVADQNCAVQEVRTMPRVTHILLIVFASLALLVYFLWSLLSKRVAMKKRFLPSAAFLRDKRDTMVAYIFVATIVLAFLYWLFVLIVERENFELRAFQGLFICINSVVAVHYILLLRLPKQPKCACAEPLGVMTG